METRSIYQALWRDLAAEKSMIFLSGPRQVGKTTFRSEIIAKGYPHTTYFNWDILDNKKTLLENPYFFQSVDVEGTDRPLVILDDIHKYRQWKNYLKGVYDKFHDRFSFAILGSGRLDISKNAGDAMTGRFLEMHLFPLTAAELARPKTDIKQFLKDPISGMDFPDASESASVWKELFNLGGFPEPFLSGKESAWRRWSANYGRQIIREDMRSLNEIKLIDDIETLFSLLPTRVGSPVSINNLATDLQVSFPAVKNWLHLFDYFYLTFRISPWTKKVSARFENMVALELLRAVRSWNEWG